MDEIKSKLQGGVDEKKKMGSERLKAVLEEVKKRGSVSESELAKATGLERKEVLKYAEYLQGNGLVEVKKRMFKDAEITAVGARGKIQAKKEELQQPEKEPTPEKKVEEPKPQETARAPPEAPSPKKAEAPTETPEPAETPAPELPATSPEPEAQPAPQQPQEHAPAPQDQMSAEKILPETEEELKEVAKSLITDFMGVMRLHGEAGGKTYTAALLIDKGDVVAVSFEHMDEAEVTYGDDGMREIQSKFLGTKGELEIFEIGEDDLNASISANINQLLSTPVKLSALNITINQKWNEEKAKKTVSSMISGMFSHEVGKETSGEQRQARKASLEKIAGSISLIDFARNVKLDAVKAKKFEELRKAKQLEAAQGPDMVDPIKAARLEALKARRAGGKPALPQMGVPQAGAAPNKQARKPQEASAMRGEKTPVKTIKFGRKVETTIDKLYQMVTSQGKVKVNDALAAKLKVSKPQMEQWAMILEEHNLVELHYPTIGEPEIVNVHDKAGKKDEPDEHKKR